MPAPAGPSPMQLPATWSATAAGYAEDVATHSEVYAAEVLRLVSLGASDRVLDVAAGPGPLAFLAASKAAQVIATDFAPGMVEQIQLRAGRDGVKNLEAQVMDAQTLAFPDEAFDVVCCMFGMMFVPDRDRAFREMHRVLRPGGRIAIGTWGPIEHRPLMQVGFEAMAEALPDLPRPAKGDLQLPDDCVREVTAAGFRDVNATTFSAAIHVDTAEHYLRVVGRAGAPFVALRKKLGDEAWAPVEARLLEAVRRRIPEGGAELGAEAVLTVGRR